MSTTSLPSAIAPNASAEAQAAAFSSDDRIYFSTQTGRWTFEDEDGAEYEYDPVKAVWLPVMDEEMYKAQQAAYSIQGVDEEAPAAPVLARQNKKRKPEEDYTSDTTGINAGPSGKRNKPGAKQTERKSKNTAVYVTGLPPDTEAEEVIARFNKCGVLEEDDEGEPKVKLYAKEDGTFSGEALVVYFKEESVALAVAMLDDAELRIGDSNTRMNVSQADFNHKSNGGRATDAPRKVMDRKKVSRRIGKMQKKLEDWDSEDEFGPAPDKETAANKNSRVVVLKHMFTQQELAEDATLLLDLKDDVREECSNLGDVTNVVLYDEEPEGIMTVKFRDPISAQACVLKMHGRYFAGRQVQALLYNGKQRFKRSGTHDAIEGEGDEAEKKRLEQFTQWLMTEGD